MTDKFHSIQEDRFEREQGVRMVLAPFQPSTASSSNPNFLLPSNYEQVPVPTTELLIYNICIICNSILHFQMYCQLYLQWFQK